MIKRIVLFLMAVLVLVALGILVSPMIIGNQIKTHYTEVLNQIFSRQGIKFKLLSYERGWYTDHATVQVDLSQSRWAINGQSQLIFEQTIDVGPILRKPSGGYLWQLARIHTNGSQGKTNYQSEVLLDLHKTVFATGHLTEVSLSKEGKTSTLTNASMTFKIKPNWTEIQATIGSVKSWSGAVSLPPSLVAQGILVTKTSEGEKSNATNSMSIRIAQLALGDNPDKRLDGQDVLIQRKTIRQGTALTVNYRLYTKKLSIGNNPSRTIDLDFTVNDLSDDLLQSLSHDITLFLQPDQSFYESNVLQDLVKVLSHGLTLSINQAIMSTQDGSVQLSGSVNLPKATNLAGILNPLAGLTAQLNGKVPMNWLTAQVVAHQQQSKEEATTQIRNWVKDGLLRQEADEFLFTLVYKGGQFFLMTPDHQKLARFYWSKPPQMHPNAVQ
jgi:hypothetical protein